jgi:hypothetical protein
MLYGVPLGFNGRSARRNAFTAGVRLSPGIWRVMTINRFMTSTSVQAYMTISTVADLS